jgi:UDP-N-acetylmuramyl pentapeptide phosphotransferase/UDP-N-acetylglucosamine-1-phosphate transferase
VQSLPLLASLAVAAVIVPACVRALREQGLVRENYRGAAVAFPAGAALVVAALIALIPVALVGELGDSDVFSPGFGEALIYVVGVSLLGLFDDVAGGGPAVRRSRTPTAPTAEAAAARDRAAEPRGWRGHARATARGRPSTGALKAAGSLGLALYVLSGEGAAVGEYLLAVAVLVLSTNFFNLLDLRPGRSAKALLLLGAGLTLGSLELDPLWALGLFVGPILVFLPLDLRELGMLGDTGSNAIGAVAGLWLVLTLSTSGQAVALALIAVATAYGEFRSISTLIERTPGLRQLDSLGRPSHA